MAERPLTYDRAPLMLPEEVAVLFGISERTVKEWARNAPEWIGAVRTPGNQWRFRPARVHDALREGEHARPS